MLQTTPTKYSFYEATSVAPTRSRRSVTTIFAVVLEVIVTCDSAAARVRYLDRVEHCAIQVYGTSRENEDRRRLKVVTKSSTWWDDLTTGLCHVIR